NEDDTFNAAASRAIVVDNVAPTAVFTNNGPVFNGGPVVVTFSSPVDPSPTDTAAGFRYSYDFDNNGSFNDPGDLANVTSLSALHTFALNGTYTVHGRISDKDGGFTDYTTLVTVKNLGLLLLDPSGAGALIASGNSNLTVNGGGIILDS